MVCIVDVGELGIKLAAGGGKNLVKSPKAVVVGEGDD